MEDDNQNSSIIALKIIMILSLVLVGMDLLEVYFSYISLKAFSLEFNLLIFEECIKYHMFTQIVFTIFATMAGLSAFTMSAGLLISQNFFAKKALESFVNFNYNIFGPYLLAMSILGFTYYQKVLYNCSREDFSVKSLNYSTLLSLIICFIFSFLITFVYSFFEGYYVMLGSIRFNRNGYNFLGKLFWRYVFNRRRDEFPRSNNAIDNQFDILYNEGNQENRQNMSRGLIDYQNAFERNDINNNYNDVEMSNINVAIALNTTENELREDNRYNLDNDNLKNLEENAYSNELNTINNFENNYTENEDLANVNFNDINIIKINNLNNKNVLLRENKKLN